MEHKCGITKEEKETTLCRRVRDKLRSYTLVSRKNPNHFNLFKSATAVRKEQKRHLRVNRYAIHPYSHFRGVYEAYLVILYTNVLIFKPVCGFFNKEHYMTLPMYRDFTIMLDFLCWIDIIITFFSGFVKQMNELSTIELKFHAIAKRYIVSPYFICDVLSSIPKGTLYYRVVLDRIGNNHLLYVMMDVLTLLKIVRIVPLFSYIKNTTCYFGIRSKSVSFFTCITLISVLTVHWSACFQYGVPRATALLSPSFKNRTWIHKTQIAEQTFFQRYNHAFFKTSAYILGIRQTMYEIELENEFLLAIMTYLIGKILVAFIWLILAMAILNSRSIHIKFWELMNELDEYMNRKNLPVVLRDRLSHYYDFKYQRRYFKEGLLGSLLPDNFKRDVRMHICKTMIKSVSIFSEISHEEVSAMMDHLIPEIFMPQDTIIQHGTYGDAMYFLFSGTVAVYSRSGKEICHLQDGAYFGEISLIFPEEFRNASIIAIETSLLYRLEKTDFDRYLVRNKNVMEKIMKGAEKRLHQATDIENEYKNYQFRQTFQALEEEN